MQRDFGPTAHILASKRKGTLYTRVTSDLPGRIFRHRTGQLHGFTRKYRVRLLVWFEQHSTMEHAMLVETANPDWCDLAEDFGFEPLS